MLDTLVGLDKHFTGSKRSTARLLQSLADAIARPRKPVTRGLSRLG
ncbi:MAG: hypothetical protein JNJ54_23900 [Myxococcaceae bacterium]|nr:hypothetical protein [Myxococcaceae bacterium]